MNLFEDVQADPALVPQRLLVVTDNGYPNDSDSHYKCVVDGDLLWGKDRPQDKWEVDWDRTGELKLGNEFTPYVRQHGNFFPAPLGKVLEITEDV